MENKNDLEEELLNPNFLKKTIAALPGAKEEGVAILNGFFGDKLASADSTLAITMSLHMHYLDDDLDITNIVSEVSGAKHHICFFVHGVMAKESVWKFAGKPQQDYGTNIDKSFDTTSLYLRYNSGLHISTNGQKFAAMIHSVISQWPVRVDSISFVGHSMGGLVTRSACYYGEKLGYSWVKQIKRIFLLGVPSKGAPLEKIVNVASFTLNKVFNPWTKLISKIFDSRSDGIKDLRYAYLLDEDWQEQDQSKIIPRDSIVVPLLSGVNYYIAVGSFWKNVEHPIAQIFGDAMVTQFSAKGQGLIKDRVGIFEKNNIKVFPRISHVALVNSPLVNDQILLWWSQE